VLVDLITLMYLCAYVECSNFFGVDAWDAADGAAAD